MMRALLALAAILITMPPVLAGDWAERRILGFSPDGSTFAFEEFGIRDGSGFPYSNIYVIDTATDSWVKDTPIRVTVKDKSVPLDAVRADAFAAAEPVLAARRVSANDYRTVVSNPPTELSADPHTVRFMTAPPINQRQRAWELKLTPLAMDGGAYCANFGAVNGFRLTLYDPGNKARRLHQDATLPESRLCPIDYAITEVIIFRPGGQRPSVMVVLLNLIRQGFEGPDRRYLAVAAQSHDF